jgi:hypothetical protein
MADLRETLTHYDLKVLQAMARDLLGALRLEAEGRMDRGKR